MDFYLGGGRYKITNITADQFFYLITLDSRGHGTLETETIFTRYYYLGIFTK